MNANEIIKFNGLAEKHFENIDAYKELGSQLQNIYGTLALEASMTKGDKGVKAAYEATCAWNALTGMGVDVPMPIDAIKIIKFD